MNRHRLVFALFLVAAAVPAQVVQHGSGSPKPGEWTANQVFDSCKKLFKALGLKTEGIAQMKLNYRPMRRGPGEWHCRKEPEQYFITFLASNGMVTEFGFGKRLMSHATGGGRSNKQFFKNEKQARAHLLKLARALGVPQNAEMSVFEWAKKADLALARPAPAMTAKFAIAKGKPFAEIVCDPSDGALVRYTRKP